MSSISARDHERERFFIHRRDASAQLARYVVHMRIQQPYAYLELHAPPADFSPRSIRSVRNAHFLSLISFWGLYEPAPRPKRARLIEDAMVRMKQRNRNQAMVSRRFLPNLFSICNKGAVTTGSRSRLGVRRRSSVAPTQRELWAVPEPFFDLLSACLMRRS